MPPVIIAAVAGAAAAAAGAWAAGVTITLAIVATGAAISASMAALQMVMAPKVKPFRQEMQDRTHSIRQPITPRQIVYGKTRTGGPIVYMKSTANHLGKQENKWLQLIIVLATHEVEAIDDVYFDENVLPLGADGAVTGGKYFDEKWNVPAQRPRARVWKHTGAPGQVADARLIGVTGGDWTAAHVGHGIAYLYVELEYTASIYTSGIPNITAIVRGKKVYDPRDGVTRYSTNAALCIRDYMTLPARLGGVGVTEDELDGPNWIAQANLCDEAMPLDGGGTESRYTINGTIALSASNSPRNTLEGLLTSCGGTLMYAGGRWKLLAAAYRNPVATPLTIDDLRDDLSFVPRPSRKDIFNGVKGTFSSPEKNWQPADYPPVKSDAFMTEDDNERIWREMDLPFTVSGATAQRLAKIALLKARQPITVSVPAKLTMMRVQAGDVLNVTLARYGWSAKPFEVVEWAFSVGGDGSLGCDLSLRETHPSVYDWSTSEEQTIDPAPNTTLPDWRSVPEVENLSADSSNSLVVTGADGTLISRVLVTWGVTSSGVIERYDIHWRLNGSTDWQWQATIDGNTSSETFSFSIDNLPVGTVIDVRVRAVNSLGVPGNFVTILAHTIAGYTNKPNPPITGLKVTGAPVGNPGQFLTADAVFEWSGGETLGALFKGYIVTIRDATTNAVRRAVPVSVPRFTYLFADNAVDGLARTFKIGVQVQTRLGGLSTEVQLTAANPVPALPTAVSITGDFRTVTMRYVPPTDPDYAGVLVWLSQTSGFTPSGTAPGTGNCVYAGPDTLVVIPATPGTTYYLRYAAYDGFSRTGLTQSGEIAATTVRISHADLADEIIETSNLIPSLNTKIAKIDVIETAVSTETTARQTADEGLALRIDSVTATSAGFDAAAIWRFDTTVESWAASGSTLVWQTGGKVRQTSTGTDPYLTSPAGQTINGAVNRFIKARVTRIAGSGWDGRAYYSTTTRAGRSASFLKTRPNPNLAIGATTVLTWDMHALTAGGTEWQSNTIVQFWLDLGSTAADIFDIDWIGVGAEAPAASTAAIIAEAATRANADSANATAIQTVQTTVNGHTASIETAATSIDGLEAQYTVKVQTNGYVSGYGLASTVRDGTPTSSFVVSADRFAVAKPGAGGLAPTIPFVIVTKGATPVLSFDGYASFSKILSGTIDTETLYVGGPNVILDGPNRNIRINNGTYDLFKAGQVSTGVYGIEIRDASNNVIMSSGAGLAAGSVTAAKLAGGAGVNLAYNADLQFNTDGFVASDNSTGQTINISRNVDANNTIPGLGLLAWSVPGTPTSGSAFTLQSNNQAGQRFAVVAGRRYEAHAMMGQYRAGYVHVSMYFLNAAGTLLQASHGSQVTQTGLFNRIDQLRQSFVFATAPANAVTCAIRLWCQCNGGANPYGVATRIYFGEANANQTEVSPWVPGPVPLNLVGGISGAGTLAGKNTVAYGTADVSGFGALAEKNAVTYGTGDVSGFGTFAQLSQITQSNVSTYIASAAIQSAHINTLTADKLAAGNINSQTYISAGNGVAVLDGRDGGRIAITDPRTGLARVWAGHLSGVDYGFWLWDYAGNEIFGSSGLTGTYIKDLTVARAKILDGAINGVKIEDLAASNSAGASAVNVNQLGVALTVTGKPVTMIVSVQWNHASAPQGTTNRTNAIDLVSSGTTLISGIKSSSIDSDGAGTTVASYVYTFTPTAGAKDFFVLTGGYGALGNRASIFAIENRK